MVRRVREELSVKPLAAVSNVSSGLPNRRLLNRTLLGMLIEAGFAGAILDPTDAGISEAICAAGRSSTVRSAVWTTSGIIARRRRRRRTEGGSE